MKINIIDEFSVVIEEGRKLFRRGIHPKPPVKGDRVAAKRVNPLTGGFGWIGLQLMVGSYGAPTLIVGS